MSISTLEKQHRKKVLAHLLGDVLTPLNLLYIFIFIIGVEIVVVPAQSLFGVFIQNITGWENTTTPYLVFSLFIAMLIFALFYFCVMLFIQNAKTTLPLKLVDQPFKNTDIVHKHKPVHLLLNLSNPKCEHNPVEPENLQDVLATLPTLESADFQEKWEQSALKTCNWRQPLLVINAYLKQGIFLNIHLVCSDRSAPYSEAFLKIINDKTMTTNLLGDMQALPAIDFMNLEECAEILDKTVNRLEKETPDYAIVIDITGGTAPLSVAGTIVSFAHDRRFQYMTTDEKSAQLHHYAAEYGTSEQS